ncbi:Uncharacterised protein [Mycobacteroides abscessus subsp. abscessus]|nr:Uncharacterised protein [Mycobacteroides abscessus subsp. abscessus]
MIPLARTESELTEGDDQSGGHQQHHHGEDDDLDLCGALHQNSLRFAKAPLYRYWRVSGALTCSSSNGL